MGCFTKPALTQPLPIQGSRKAAGVWNQGSRGLHVEAHRHKGDPQASRSHRARQLVALGGGFR